jgi:hypothetical protein
VAGGVVDTLTRSFTTTIRSWRGRSPTTLSADRRRRVVDMLEAMADAGLSLAISTAKPDGALAGCSTTSA